MGGASGCVPKIESILLQLIDETLQTKEMSHLYSPTNNMHFHHVNYTGGSTDDTHCKTVHWQVTITVIYEYCLPEVKTVGTDHAIEFTCM